MTKEAAANQFNEVYESIYQAQRDAEELQAPAHLKDQLMSALTDAMHALYRMDTDDPDSDKPKPKKEKKNKEYMFTFEEGGWNTVWAKTKKRAIKAALKEYKDSPGLTVRVSSVHKSTESGLKSAMSLFY